MQLSDGLDPWCAWQMVLYLVVCQRYLFVGGESSDSGGSNWVEIVLKLRRWEL